MDELFAAYVASIQKIAEGCGATEPGKPYRDPDAWLDAFNDGLSPSEAWAEEVSAAATMLG